MELYCLHLKMDHEEEEQKKFVCLIAFVSCIDNGSTLKRNMLKYRKCNKG